MSDDAKQPTAPVSPVYRVPAHGHGRLRVIRPGESGNPSGQNGRYGEVVRMCRESGPAVTRRLIQIALDESEEPRVSVVAAQEILGRAFGRIPAEVKDLAGAPAVDWNQVSDAKLAMLIEALRLAKAAGPAPQGEPEG